MIKKYFFRVYRDDLKLTISQKLKIWKLVFHSFQNIAPHFGPKNENCSIWGNGEGGLHVVNVDRADNLTKNIWEQVIFTILIWLVEWKKFIFFITLKKWKRGWIGMINSLVSVHFVVYCLLIFVTSLYKTIFALC